MKFGICPTCNEEPKRNIFIARCEKCGIELKQSGATVAITLVISIGSMLIAMLVAYQATPQIVESGAENLKDVLFWYYMKLFIIAMAVSYTAKFIIYKWFTKYEPKST